MNDKNKIVSFPGVKIQVGSLAGLPVSNEPKNARQMTAAKLEKLQLDEVARHASIAPLTLPAEKVMPAPADATDQERAAAEVWARALKALATCEEVYHEFLKFRMSPRMAGLLQKMQLALGLPDPPPIKEKGVIITEAKKFFKGLSK